MHCISDWLDDYANVASLAVDVSEYHKNRANNEEYLSALQSELKAVDLKLNNVVRAILEGASGKTVNDQLKLLEEQKKGILHCRSRRSLLLPDSAALPRTHVCGKEIPGAVVFYS